MSKIRDFVALKKSGLYTEKPTQTVRNACVRMRELGIGALVILDESGALLGIFNERCISFGLIPEGLDPVTTPVSRVMKRDQRVVTMDADVDSVSALMLSEKVRYLVVVDDDNQPIHLISMGDVQNYFDQRSRMTIEYLSSRSSLLLDA